MVFALAKRLPAHGFRVRVVAAGGGGVMAADFHEAGIPLVIAPETRVWQRRQTTEFLRRDFRAHWPGILHTHLGGDVWAGFVARREGIHPWISTVHDIQSVGGIKGWMRGAALRSADRVVCISETVRAFVEREYRRTDDMDVIRLGVDLGSVDQGVSVRPEKRLQRFVVIGRLVVGKRVDVLIAALSEIKEPWHLDVVGDGPERGRLEAMVKSLRLQPRVRFVGSVPDVGVYLSQAEVCLFASREEGQGMVVLEAAARGVPVIASDLLVVRELFNEQSLALVPVSAPALVWTRLIQETMYDPQTAHTRASAARAIVQAHSSVERMVEEYVELYRRLLSKTT